MSTAAFLRIPTLPPSQTLAKRHAPPSSTSRTPLLLHHRTPIDHRNPSRSPISMSSRAAVPFPDRILSALSYSLPFLNSLHYGRFLFAKIPAIGRALEPLLPAVAVYRSLPYASFLAFFALYLGVVRNPVFGRYVRFNAMQAVVLDVLLALPAILQRIVGVPASGLGFRLLEIGYDVVFVAAGCCFVYGFVSCVLGKTPYLPLVASAADRQL